MKSRLYTRSEPLKRLASKRGWGVLFVAVVVALGLSGGYVAAGILGLLTIAFTGIVASTSPGQAKEILAARAGKRLTQGTL